LFFALTQRAQVFQLEQNYSILNNLHTNIGSFSGKEHRWSFENLELFRNNELPIMVATKAFGMKQTKCSFTINMNYSGSLSLFKKLEELEETEKWLYPLYFIDYKFQNIKSI
jgi:hypothetical protein